jgi:uncharacterized membrane protein
MAKKPQSNIVTNENKKNQDTKNQDTKKLVEILEQLPEEKRQLILQQVSVKSYSGPVMPPEYAEHYEVIIPGSAERILIMAEKQANHRMEMEQKAVDAQIEDARADSKRLDKAMNKSFFFLFLLVIAGFGLTILNHDNAGMSAFGVAGTIGIYKIIETLVPHKKKKD